MLFHNPLELVNVTTNRISSLFIEKPGIYLIEGIEILLNKKRLLKPLL